MEGNRIYPTNPENLVSQNEKRVLDIERGSVLPNVISSNLQVNQSQVTTFQPIQSPQQTTQQTDVVSKIIEVIKKMISTGPTPSPSQVKKILQNNYNADVNSTDAWLKFLIDKIIREYKRKQSSNQ
ncbi:MAG: hypothetical protein N3A71_00085 [Candidatus Dojkabacteria bacterium]|nr:hypothetical protein [Candidatus Dojkabacteria bacterium]